MSIKAAYVTRNRMLDASKWCFYRDDTDADRLNADSIINAAFDARQGVTEIPFIALENEFRARGEHELINNLIMHLDPSEIR